MAPQNPLLRKIPKVDELLLHPVLRLKAEELSPVLTAQAVRQVLDGLRGAILAGACESLPSNDQLAEAVAAQIERNALPSLRRVINATGVILHTNLGRAPLAKAAVQAVCDAAEGYSTLEYNVQTGDRGSRHSHVKDLLTTLTGAEDALAVNNNAAAVLLTLSALTCGKEVIISRGELVEIGGSFRVPDVMAQSGSTLREVGTTNKTHLSDYQNALDAEKTGALLKVHTSNFKVVGFTEQVPLDALAALGHAHGLPVLHDLGSGALLPLESLGFLDEPTVPQSLLAGCDVVTFSGDKLLGGPQAGIIVGKKCYLDKIKAHPLARAVRIDKLTLAGLESTLRLYLDPARAKREVPTLAMLYATQPELRDKAGRLMALLAPCTALCDLTLADESGQVGGGSVPTHLLPSCAIAIVPKQLSADKLEARLRACAVPIVARIAHDRLLFDVRTINESDFVYLADCIQACLQ